MVFLECFLLEWSINLCFFEIANSSCLRGEDPREDVPCGGLLLRGTGWAGDGKFVEMARGGNARKNGLWAQIDLKARMALVILLVFGCCVVVLTVLFCMVLLPIWKHKSFGTQETDRLAIVWVEQSMFLFKPFPFSEFCLHDLNFLAVIILILWMLVISEGDSNRLRWFIMVWHAECSIAFWSQKHCGDSWPRMLVNGWATAQQIGALARAKARKARVMKARIFVDRAMICFCLGWIKGEEEHRITFWRYLNCLGYIWQSVLRTN